MVDTTLAPAIFGLSSTTLTTEEKDLFEQVVPFGYIVFSRNCDNPQQLRALTDSLKSLHDVEPLILIDQEGGRVARLKAPHWEHPPAPECYAKQAETCLDDACNNAREGSRAIARTLRESGINTNCAPMCDLRYPHSHNIIGDRAYGETSSQVTALANAVAQGLLDKSVLPILKHIPGHGRATCDSHLELPVIDASIKELQQDFAPFSTLCHYPLAMTAHIIYSAIDPLHPATLSHNVIKIIRDNIGFKGLLMSDDICMKALTDDVETITHKALDAGCDLVLHCNGNYEEMQYIAKALAQHNRLPTSALISLHDYRLQ